MMVHSVDKEKIVYSDSLVGRKACQSRSFEKWDGVIIIVEPSGTSGEEELYGKKKDRD